MAALARWAIDTGQVDDEQDQGSGEAEIRGEAAEGGEESSDSDWSQEEMSDASEGLGEEGRDLVDRGREPEEGDEARRVLREVLVRVAGDAADARAAVEQGVLDVGGVKALGEPAVDRGEKTRQQYNNRVDPKPMDRVQK